MSGMDSRDDLPRVRPRRPRRARCVAIPGARFRALACWLAALCVSLAGCHDHPPGGAPGARGSEADAHPHDHGPRRGDEAARNALAGGDLDARGQEGHSEVTLTAAALRRFGIRVARARIETLEAVLTAPARLAYDAEQVAHVGSVVTGRVIELGARLGDKVEKGDVLLVVDSPELGQAQSEYLQRRAAIAVAKPTLDLAQNAFDRANDLYEKSRGIPLTELQKRLGELKAAQGALLAAETALTAAESKLYLLGMQRDAVEEFVKGRGEIDPRYEVRAPLSGEVIDREATLGELVRPETEKLMVLANLGTVWVLADIPEAQLGAVALGARATVVIPALGDETFTGSVSHVSPELDPSTRTARVRVEVENPKGRIRPGMFARVDIALGGGPERKSIVVPEDAVLSVDGEPAVFVPVEGEPNTFAKRKVAAGFPVGGKVPIHEGLSEGDLYVAAGAFVLKAELGKAGAEHEH